jgi:hypothetical protein
MPHGDAGKLEFEMSHRFDSSYKAILFLVALGVALFVGFIVVSSLQN